MYSHITNSYFFELAKPDSAHAPSSKMARRLASLLCLLLGFCSVFPLNAARPIRGEESVASGPADWIEGEYKRIAYAPGTDQSVSMDGKWRAIVSSNGIQISITTAAEERVVALIGTDQFELLTRPGGFQEGAARTVTNQSIIGSDLKIAQYIAQRIANRAHLVTTSESAPSYVNTWPHFTEAIKTDFEGGLQVQRALQESTVEDSWYISRYALTNLGRIPVPAYPTNGFLAARYKSASGPIASGESISVQEFWPKPGPDLHSSEDVFNFRDTKLAVTLVKTVTNHNLLPTIKNADAFLTDHRFTNIPAGKFVSTPLKQGLWILRDSVSFAGMERNALILAVDHTSSDKKAEAKGRPWTRVIIFVFLAGALSVPFLLFARSRAGGAIVTTKA